MTGTALLFLLAFGIYVLNACFGASVRVGLISSAGFRWAHHALYLLTFITAITAASSVWWGGSQAGWYLLPALAALAALPYIGSARSHPCRHILAALLPLPFYILSLIAALRS